AGVLAGVDDHRPALAEACLTARDRVLIQHRGGRARDHGPRRRDSVDPEVHAATNVHGRHPSMVRAMAQPVRTDGVVALRPWSRADAAELVACLDGDAEIGRWL